MNANLFARVNQIIKTCDAVQMGVIDEDGYPSVSTVSTLEPEDMFTAYFSTGLDANKTKRLLRDNRASICYRKDGDNITLVGEAEILTDQETKDRLWTDWFIEHFPGGKTDPNYCVIKFTARRVSLWVDNESAEFTVKDILTVQSRCGLLCDTCTYREPNNCGKCVETNGRPFHGECPAAVCCQEKGLAHCGLCQDMPCDLLKEYSCGDSEHCDNPKGARIEVCRAWAAQK